MVKEQSTSWTEEMQDTVEIKRVTPPERLIISPPRKLAVNDGVDLDSARYVAVSLFGSNPSFRPSLVRGRLISSVHPPDNAMTTKLPDDLRQAIEKEGVSPVHLVDAATNVHYVLMRAEQYMNLSALFADGEDFDPRELYPLMAKSAAAAGWDDPDLDAYNDYDAHKKP